MSTSSVDGDPVDVAPARTPPVGPGAADRVVRSFARHLRSSPSRTLSETAAFQGRAFERAVTIVRVFYVASFVWTVEAMGGWPTLAHVTQASPQWPATWIDSANPGRGISVILFAYGAASLAAVAFPQFRLVRLAYTVTLLEYMAVINGFGKVNHNLHGWLFVSAAFVFLPRGPWRDRRRVTTRQPFLNVIWVAQVLVLFFYTLTGLWKIVYAVHDLGTSRTSAFEFSSFSYLVAGRLLETSQQTILGDWFVHHHLPGWLLFNGTMYLESAALLVAFRPRLHRVWGFGLILFHLGTLIAMGFTFDQNVLLVGLLFVCSPVAPERVSVKETVLDLPGVHVIARWWSRRSVRAVDRAGTAAEPASAT